MNKLLTIVLSFSLLFVPLIAYAQSGQGTSNPPPVGSPLVREGDFAVKLVEALKLGTAANEAEAESMLTSAGIAPRNGWISDYPVTPDILAEIQRTVGDAADGNRLSMGKEDSLRVEQSVEASFGLAIVPDTSGKYAEAQPPTTPEYTEPSDINNYYSEEGPPVVTYYPPPWDYYYLYAWVPSPFWCDGFFFPGFFVLSDFDIIVADHDHDHHHHEKEVISNHVFDPKTKTVARIDPVTRTEKTLNAQSVSHSGFATTDGRRGAAAILEHSMGRVGSRESSTMSERRGEGNLTSPRTGHWFQVRPNTHSGITGGSHMSGRSLSAPTPPKINGSFGHGAPFGGFGGGHSFGRFWGGGGRR